jgi:hypothetical protein
MARAIALTRHAYEAAQVRRSEIARSAIVLGCALALILAGQATPF